MLSLPCSCRLSEGSLAYWDTVFTGLVPCKVISFDYPNECTVKITAKRGPYERGQIIKSIPAYHVVPRNAVYQRDRRTFIRPYTIEKGKGP